MSPLAAGEAWIVDASVALKWFLPVEREPEGELARAAIGRLALRTTTLAEYEIGNILVRGAGWTAVQLSEALSLLREICGEPVSLLTGDHRRVADVAREHSLTFYDASYVAIAARTGRRLLSADRDLLAPQLACSLSQALE
jgi:predicted nucleic acid-binding protein